LLRDAQETCRDEESNNMEREGRLAVVSPADDVDTVS
jgi:hypothetical protein